MWSWMFSDTVSSIIYSIFNKFLKFSTSFSEITSTKNWPKNSNFWSKWLLDTFDGLNVTSWESHRILSLWNKAKKRRLENYREWLFIFTSFCKTQWVCTRFFSGKFPEFFRKNSGIFPSFKIFDYPVKLEYFRKISGIFLEYFRNNSNLIM